MKHLNITADQVDLVKEALTCAMVGIITLANELNEMGLLDTAKDLSAKYKEYNDLLKRVNEQTKG